MADGAIDIPGCLIEQRSGDTGLHADRCGTIGIDGLFEPVEVPPDGPGCLRADLFQPGRFSALDALLWASAERGIPVEHHYDEARPTRWGGPRPMPGPHELARPAG